MDWLETNQNILLNIINICFNHSGYNEDGGHPSPASALTSHTQSFDLVKAKVETDYKMNVRFGAIGHSLGTSAVSRLAANRCLHWSNNIFISISHFVVLKQTI